MSVSLSTEKGLGLLGEMAASRSGKENVQNEVGPLSERYPLANGTVGMSVRVITAMDLII